MEAPLNSLLSVVILDGVPQNLSPMGGGGEGIFVLGNQFIVV